MVNWVLTLGLQNLRAQINAWAPDRDHTSDGTIGDQAHLSEAHSGHDPDDVANSHAEWNSDPDSTPEVRAIDIDVDFRNGSTAQALVDHIRGLSGVASVLRYVIYNRRIYEASNGWASRAYTGESAHTEHIHFSGAYTQASDNNTTFNYRLEEIPVALTSADKTWIQQQIAAVTAATVAALTKQTALNGPDKEPDGTYSTPIGNAGLSQGIPALPGGPRTEAYKVFAEINETVAAIAEKVGVAV